MWFETFYSSGKRLDQETLVVCSLELLVVDISKAPCRLQLLVNFETHQSLALATRLGARNHRFRIGRLVLAKPRSSG